MKTASSIVELVAAGMSIAAGIYLLSRGSSPVTVSGVSGQSWFEVLAHGLAIYFIARGLSMAAAMLRAQAGEESGETRR